MALPRDIRKVDAAGGGLCRGGVQVKLDVVERENSDLNPVRSPLQIKVIHWSIVGGGGGGVMRGKVVGGRGVLGIVINQPRIVLHFIG